jgi:hypothetical protein
MIESTELLISVSIDDGDQTELDNLTRELKSEIEQLSVDSINDVSAGEALEGTKAADWAQIGQIVVEIVPTAVPLLFTVLRLWLERKSSKPVRINIRVGKRLTHQIEYDPAKTSTKELELLVKVLKKGVRN